MKKILGFFAKRGLRYLLASGGGGEKALKELGKFVGNALAGVLPDDIEDPVAAFAEGFAEGLEKAN